MVPAIFFSMIFYHIAVINEGVAQMVFTVASCVSQFCVYVAWEKTKDRISALESKLKEKDND